MFCPKCANQSNDDQKFCKVCGTNLVSVNLAMQDPRSLMTEHEWKRLRRSGKNFSDADFDAVWKRMGSQNLIRSRTDRSAMQATRLMQAGIITGCIGMGVTTFLYILFTAIAKTQTDAEDIAVLHSMWAVGLVPFFVGLGLFLSGALFRRKTEGPPTQVKQITQPISSSPPLLTPQDEATFTPSVTEHTTRHLYEEPVPRVRSAHDTKEVN